MRKSIFAGGLIAILASASALRADHGGTHCKYIFANEASGLACTVAFDDGSSLKGKLYVMGNTQGELMAEISGQVAMANLDLAQVADMTRRTAEGQRHMWDVTTKGGSKIVLTAFGGNVVYLRGEGVTTVEIVFRKVNSIRFQ